MSLSGYRGISPAEQFAEARHHSDAGRPARMGLAVGGGLVGAFAADWRGAAASIALIVCWEMLIAPALKRRVDAVAGARGLSRACGAWRSCSEWVRSSTPAFRFS